MADCTNCSEKRLDPVPYLVHESDMARMERANRRSHVLCIVLAVVLLLSWIGFAVYESQFETVTETTTQEVWQEADGNGSNRFIGGNNYGETEG